MYSYKVSIFGTCDTDAHDIKKSHDPTETQRFFSLNTPQAAEHCNNYDNYEWI